MKLSAIWEISYPVILGLGAGTLYYTCLNKYILTSDLKESFSTILTISSVGVGFLASAKSILLSLNQTKIIRRLRQAKFYERLVRFLLHALWLSFASMVLSGILFFCATPEMAKRFMEYRDFVVAGWLFVVVAAAAACFRACHLFSKCLMYAAKESE